MTTARKGGRRAALLASAFAIALIAQPALAQHRAPGLAPALDTAEGGLWAASDTAERQARRSPELNADPALAAYVRQVSCGIAAEYCDHVRIYVMDRPAFNATMAPNGYMEVWSGLLLRAETEAELAFVLGHEIGHFAENHTIERWNALKTRMGVAMAVGFAAGAAGAYYAVDLSALGNLAYLGAIAATFNYSREQETEADRLGFTRAADAGYDAAAGAALWRNLQAETKASSFPSIRRSDAAGSVFRTHPITADRVSALDTLAAGRPDGGRTERERYRAAIRPHLASWLADDLRKRDFEGGLVLTQRLERDGMDRGVLGFHRGQIYRQRRSEGDLERARDAYLAASAFEDAPVAVWRELGDLQGRLGDKDAARAAWTIYLERATSADDRWIVEDSLTALGGL